MHWVRITRPGYEQSRRHAGKVGEVVGYWGPENSAEGRKGYLVEFSDGEIVGVAEDEVEMVVEPETPGAPEGEGDGEEGGAGFVTGAAA